jgi:hypothetical protein
MPFNSAAIDWSSFQRVVACNAPSDEILGFNKKQRQIMRKGNRLLGQLDRDGRLSIQIRSRDSS